MTPFVKVLLGLLMLAPAIGITLAAVAFPFTHPTMTEVQLFGRMGWMPYVSLILAIPGILLIEDAVGENEA